MPKDFRALRGVLQVFFSGPPTSRLPHCLADSDIPTKGFFRAVRVGEESRFFKAPLKGAREHGVSASLRPQQKHGNEGDNDTRDDLGSCLATPVHGVPPVLERRTGTSLRKMSEMAAY